ncbi:MAG: hypothetical protein WC220_00055 [Pedobacter sp.]|jgi:hypothetical protein
MIQQSKSKVINLVIMLTTFVAGASIFLPTHIFALSPEKAKEAQDYANRIGEEAIRKARASGTYDYDVVGIVRTVIITILMMIVFAIMDRWLSRHRILRIFPVRILFYLFYVVLWLTAIFSFNFFIR